MDADNNMAAVHHVEAEEAFSNMIDEDHHHENALNIRIDPDQ